MPASLDLHGRTFGRLTVVAFAGNKGKKRTWLCQCECGKTSIAFVSDLTNGRHQSCGCRHKEIVTKHGQVRTPTYYSWQSMKDRCLNSNNPGFRYYGERGITVCERWMHFENFFADMGERPSSDHSLDRKDYNGSYCPENCRWATHSEQALNKRSNHICSLNGRSQTVTEWANELGIHRNTIDNRLSKGWSAEKALTTPVNTRYSRRK